MSILSSKNQVNHYLKTAKHTPRKRLDWLIQTIMENDDVCRHWWRGCHQL